MRLHNRLGGKNATLQWENPRSPYFLLQVSRENRVKPLQHVEAAMQKLAFLIAAGIACLFISAHFVLATDLEPHQQIQWIAN